MLKLISNLWIWINVIFFSGLGIAVLYKHNTISSHLGFNLINTTAVAEFKATYGGLMLALSIIMVVFKVKNQISSLYTILTFIYLGYFFGRLAAILFNNATSNQTIYYLLFECVGLIISIYFFANIEN